MEQLVWSIIIILFIIFIALKNRAKNLPDTNIDGTSDNEQKKAADGRLGRYMEELLGISSEGARLQTEIRRETPLPLKEEVAPDEEPEVKSKIGQFETPLTKVYEKKEKPPLPEERKREIDHARFPWGALSKKDLSDAIILSEIIGPPISKRKSHRSF